MISYIKGELTEVFEDTVVVETNGIGYHLSDSADEYCR